MTPVASFVLAAWLQFAQPSTGELHLTVTDPAGLAVATAVEIVNEAQQFRSMFTTTAQGTLVARRLAFGTYRVNVTADGFAPFSGVVQVRSVVPTEFRVTLAVAAVQTQLTVRPTETLIDPSQTASASYIGTATVQQRLTALPGRALPDLVNAQPGWLLEANGILHPRGSEYQTQYVIDGLPLTDNRSPAFAPELDPDEVHSMKVLTGGYPAEYGRKLGGVIEVVTASGIQRGVHAALSASAGSFASASGMARVGYAGERFAWTAIGAGATTDRYLDPPVEENFGNHGSTSNVALRFEHDLSTTDRFGAIVRHGASSFLVPNEHVQQEAGQRQDSRARETALQFSYQRVLSTNAVMDVRASARRVDSALWSNEFAVPIHVTQDRGFREVYFKAAVAGHRGIHEWKAGGDVVVATLDEQFAYRVTDASLFDDDTAAAFAFADDAADREQALFVQDQLRVRNWTVSAGVRWDRYALLVTEHAVSPRLAVAWSKPSSDLVVRASYDRIFQTPAAENLLLASSPDVDDISEEVLRLPVRPSRGHFFEAGLSKALGRARLDVSHFRRHADQAADDDVLLNTGVSFPIAFDRSRIHGTEAKLELPQWRALSAAVAYSHMRGVAQLPITGGLFLEADAEDLLESTDQFPISQDQRHTLRAQASYRFGERAWTGLAASYNSGLPVESEGDLDEAVEQYGERIVSQVDLENERVRPSWTLDATGGVQLRRGATDLRVQIDVRNITNRLNVINFAGLFSGTALAPPRSVAVRLQLGFTR
jgi:outer membrane cobalamin receptor